MRQFKISDKLTPRMTKSAGSYLVDLEKTKLISPEREVELARLAANGDEKARNELVTANLRFVVSVAKMYARNPEDFSDVVAAGNMGLIEAAEKFDPTRGFKFISFAVWYIRKEMINHLNDNSRTVRVPINQVAILREMMKIGNEISMREGREATFDESLEELVSNNDKYASTKRESILLSTQADQRLSSLSNPLTSDSDSGSLIDILDSGVDHSDEGLKDGDFKKIIRILSKALTDTERDIVFKKHGISDGKVYCFEESFDEIAIRLERTPEGIRQKYNKSLKKMCFYGEKIGIYIYDVL
jgi:RNA polymerase primary sigma factor